MLEKLLSEIRSGGTFEVNEMAAQLETTPSLVKAMLSHLQRLGYIRSFQACAEACNGCNLRADCQPQVGAFSSTEETPNYILIQAMPGEKG